MSAARGEAPDLAVLRDAPEHQLTAPSADDERPAIGGDRQRGDGVEPADQAELLPRGQIPAADRPVEAPVKTVPSAGERASALIPMTCPVCGKSSRPKATSQRRTTVSEQSTEAIVRPSGGEGQTERPIAGSVDPVERAARGEVPEIERAGRGELDGLARAGGEDRAIRRERQGIENLQPAIVRTAPVRRRRTDRRLEAEPRQPLAAGGRIVDPNHRTQQGRREVAGVRRVGQGCAGNPTRSGGRAAPGPSQGPGAGSRGRGDPVRRTAPGHRGRRAGLSP